MPLQNIPERLAFMGNTAIFPPSPQGRIESGYISGANCFPSVMQTEPPNEKCRMIDASEVKEDKFVCVTQVRLDRTFVYRIRHTDVRVLFIPKNTNRPDLEHGDWYFGKKAVQFVDTNASAQSNQVIGIVFATRDAQVHWHAEGVLPAGEAQSVFRPLASPSELTPIEFRGIFDSQPGCGCDDH